MSKNPLPENLIIKFSDFLAEMMGLYFPPNAAKELEKKLQPIAKAFDFKELSDCLEWLMKAPLTKNQIAILAHHLTIGETYFFRDQRAFSLLEHEILPKIIQRHHQDKTLRIWSAACCTGEETYSIAILLNRVLPDITKWKIFLLATDINHSFLHRGEIGHYKQWSFRATSKEIQERYFDHCYDGSYEINSKIKKMVKFKYLNLVEDCYPDESNDVCKMDLILCNNVLIYFSQKQIQYTVSHLSETLAEGGYLMVTPIESPYVKEKRLQQVNFNGTIIFVKTSDKFSNEADQTFKPLSEIQKEPKPFKNEQTLLTIVLPSFLKLTQPKLEFNFGDQPPFPAENSAVITNTDRISDKRDPSDEVEGGMGIASAIAEETGTADEGVAADRKPTEKGNSARNSPLAKENVYESTIKGFVIEKAIEDLSTITTSEETFTKIQFLANAGQFEEAKKCCEQVLEHQKLNPLLYYLHATILQSTGHFEEAVQELKRVIFLDGSFVMAHYMLGMLNKKQGNKVGAKRHFRNAHQLLLKYSPETKIPGTEDTTAATLLNVIQEIM